MRTKPPRVWPVRQYGREPAWQQVLDDPTQVGVALVVDSPAWFAWLATASTQSFAYPVYDHAHGYIDGFTTVRKERRARGSAYWVAYRRCQGQVQKRYLGATTQLTQRCLDQVAQTFLAAG
jgi:hypothetical protein